MTKKWIAAGLTALICSTALAAPASAASIITGESFSSKTAVDKWETDQYAPEEFEVDSGELYLSVGRTGYYRARPDDKKSKTYALQGKKMEVKTPTTNTWTATVKLDVDSTWFNDGDGKKKVEFRVDLMDKNGNPLKDAPALALVKGGSGAPMFTFYNPATKTGWGTASTYINGDKDKVALELETGWHTLIIKSAQGVITYYVDEKKLGNCTLKTTDVYPEYMALNMYNYERADVSVWDNCYLYNGSYMIRQLSSEQQKEKDEDMTIKYEKKRASWTERYTHYQWPKSEGGDDKYYSLSSVKSKSGKSEKYIKDEFDSLLTKEIPDSYWDY